MSTGQTGQTQVLELVEPLDLRWRRADLPVPGPDEVLVRTLLVGVCGTDLEIVRGSSSRVPFPVVLGHEWVGEVLTGPSAGPSAGPGADLRVGDVVVGYNRVQRPDGFIAERGFEMPGGMAPVMAVAVADLVATPPTAAVEDLVLAEPTAVAAHAVSRIPGPGETTVVFGDGPIGVISALLLRAEGHRVVLVGKNPARLAHVRSLGLTAHDADEAADRLRGQVVDTVLEASGNPDAVLAALQVVRDRGLLVLVGGYPSSPRWALGWIVGRNLHVEGVVAGDGFLPAAVARIAEGVVTARQVGVTLVGADDAAQAIADLAGGRRDDVKLVLDRRRRQPATAHP